MMILHVTDGYLPQVGGIEMHVDDLARHQRAQGHEVHVVTMSPVGPLLDPPWVHRLGQADEGGRVGLWAAETALVRLLGGLQVDVVHVHISVLSPLATLAARHTAAHGIATLVTLHSMWSRVAPLAGVAQLILGLRRWPVVWSAVSDRAAGSLRDMLGPQVPVVVLPNAVDPTDWRPDPARRATTAPQVPTVVSVLRMTPTKRTLPLARMLRRVRAGVPADQPLRAVVIGDGPQRRTLERYLRRHRMDSWVELPGRLARSEIRTRLDTASVYVAPAVLESFGIAALEARAAGLPVVASSRSGVGEFITTGVEGLLGDNDAQMAAHLVRLLTDEDLRAAMGAHNSTVPPRHDWPAVYARTQELYLHAATVAAQSRHAVPSGLAVSSLGRTG